MPTKQELHEGVERYLSRHHKDYYPQYHETYDFNIKIFPGINLPRAVREQLPERTIEAVARDEASLRVRDEVEFLKLKYPWIRDYAWTGRSGGWLVIGTADSVYSDSLSVDSGPTDTRRLAKRLQDLQAIEKHVDRAKDKYVKDMETLKWWGELFPRMLWIPPGVKEWRPEK